MCIKDVDEESIEENHDEDVLIVGLVLELTFKIGKKTSNTLSSS